MFNKIVSFVMGGLQKSTLYVLIYFYFYFFTTK